MYFRSLKNGPQKRVSDRLVQNNVIKEVHQQMRTLCHKFQRNKSMNVNQCIVQGQKGRIIENDICDLFVHMLNFGLASTSCSRVATTYRKRVVVSKRKMQQSQFIFSMLKKRYCDFTIGYSSARCSWERSYVGCEG